MAHPTALADSLLRTITPLTTNPKESFEIRLNENPLFRRGTSDVILKGRLIICPSDRVSSVQSIRLRLTREKKIKIPKVEERSGSDPQWHEEEEQVVVQRWKTFRWKIFNKKTSEILRAGSNEWTFETRIQGDNPESIEGPDDNWIIYRMKAKVKRRIMQEDEIIRKIVRIVNTPDWIPDPFYQTRVIDVWSRMLKYSIAMPSGIAALGSKVEIEFRFTLSRPLKGLNIEKVRTRLKEQRIIGLREGYTSYTHDVVDETIRFPPTTDTQDISIEGFLTEGYIISTSIEIPRDLKQCLQSVDLKNFKIIHWLRHNVYLRNPDGEVHAVTTEIPLHIYISRMLPVGSNNNVMSSDNQVLPSGDVNSPAPPHYNDRHLNSLYEIFDRVGYAIPAGLASRSSTPSSSGSGTASVGNLTPMHGAAEPRALQDRLNNLNVGEGSVAPAPLDSEGQIRPQVRVNLPARRGLEDEGNDRPIETRKTDFDEEALARVPSFNTAQQAPPPPMLHETPPSYQDVTATTEPFSGTTE